MAYHHSEISNVSVPPAPFHVRMCIFFLDSANVLLGIGAIFGNISNNRTGASRLSLPLSPYK